MARIAAIRAREVLDSRGDPTVEVDVYLNDGARGRSIVPSGASTGKHEALELRDEDPRRFHGRGVRNAIEHVEVAVAPAVVGWEATDQAGLDRRLIALDGTRDKRRLGANALLGVSMAVARAAAISAGSPLYRYLGGANAAELPVPLVNILSGGLHGGGNFDFQDFMVVPLAARTFRQALEHAAAVHAAMKDVLKARGVYRAGVADEGGYAPRLDGNEAGLKLMTEAIERAGLKPGAEAAIAVDVAASQFFRHGHYHLEADHARLDAEEMIERLAAWAGRYPVVSIEDGLGEDDWAGWKELTKRLGGRTQLIGDDLFVTNLERLAQGLESGAANAILVKLSQAGTLTETVEVVEFAGENGYRAVVSARSGETEDSFIADLAVATGAGQIKIGALTRSERLAKYNRLLQIERELGPRARYRGGEVFRPGF
jgi:enolase 1/2/3